MSLVDSVADLNLIFVDVEATTRSPETGVMTEFGAVHYHSRKSFHGVLHESMPDPENPAKRALVVGGKSYLGTMVLGQFTDWISQFTGPPIFISDNNGYDAMWITCAFDRYRMEPPFGHSSRRIGDFYAGLVGDFRKASAWKKWRVTPHTHDPVDDAMGNVEAFATMLMRFTKDEVPV